MISPKSLLFCLFRKGRNPSPVDGFRGVINICLDLGYAEEDVKKLISMNAAKLIGLD